VRSAIPVAEREGYGEIANSLATMLAFSPALKPFDDLIVHVDDAINHVFHLFRPLL
jgi:hypothetical protein